MGINGFFLGFQKGKIFRGAGKNTCVPVLNCSSCPGALGACPVGALQNELSMRKTRFPFYVLGILMLFGTVLGRAVCGFLCPFGWIQELLYRIPVPKNKKLFVLKKPLEKADRVLRYLKYGILFLLVVILPLFARNQFGLGQTYFCKLICPAGTLEAGIPLLIANPSLRTGIGGLFYLKMGILVFLLVLSIFWFRPFCKYLCPLGAVYALFNSFSVYRLRVNQEKCVGCGDCIKTCPMQVNVLKNINSPECIRCGKCMDICNQDAIASVWFTDKRITGRKKEI